MLENRIDLIVRINTHIKNRNMDPLTDAAFRMLAAMALKDLSSAHDILGELLNE